MSTESDLAVVKTDVGWIRDFMEKFPETCARHRLDIENEAGRLTQKIRVLADEQQRASSWQSRMGYTIAGMSMAFGSASVLIGVAYKLHRLGVL